MEGFRRRINSIQVAFFGLTTVVVFFIIAIGRTPGVSQGIDFSRIFSDNGSITCKDIIKMSPAVDIPRHVHQMWKDKNIPQKWRELKDGCQKLNPGYKFLLWTDSDLEKFIGKKYPWFIDTYLSYPYHIQRVDAARYFILHHYGGVYIDLDIKCKAPIDDVWKTIPTDTDSILGATAPLGITNSMMISKPKHPYMLYILSRLESVNGWYVLPYWTIMFSTGPFMVWQGYVHYPCKSQVVVLTVQEQLKYFEHTHGSTWHTWDGPLMVWLDAHLAMVIIFFVVSLSASCVILYRRCLSQDCLAKSTFQMEHKKSICA